MADDLLTTLPIPDLGAPTIAAAAGPGPGSFSVNASAGPDPGALDLTASGCCECSCGGSCGGCGGCGGSCGGSCGCGCDQCGSGAPVLPPSGTPEPPTNGSDGSW